MKYFSCFALITTFITACSGNKFSTKWVHQQAPAYFKARFETTAGNFDIEAYRKWSPLAVDRLYQLIKNHYYTNIPIYRVVPGFVAQFGALDSLASAQWELYPYADEPVIKKNTTGTLSFAISGKETRRSQLYINLKDNPKLDTLNFQGVTGFPGVATVTNGMEIVNKFYAYGEKVFDMPDTVKNLSLYLKEHFPKMEYIKKAYIIN